MKKYSSLFLLIAICSCGDKKNDPSPQTYLPIVSDKIDDNTYKLDEDDLVTMSFVDGHVMLSILSEQNDFQVGISAYQAELSAGVMSVFDCFLPSECNQDDDAKNQFFVYGPYIKNPPPPASEGRSAINAPSLDLEPATFEITEIENKQLPGSYWKTKYVKGHFEGLLAYVERHDETWHVVGKKIFVEGDFEMYCSIP